MKKRLRVPVIGAGQIGLHHMKAIARCERTELVAVAESSPQRLAEAAEKFRLSTRFGDYRELLA